MIDKKAFKQETLLNTIWAAAKIRTASLSQVEDGKEFPEDLLRMSIGIVDKLIKCFSDEELDLFVSNNPEYKILINRYRKTI